MGETSHGGTMLKTIRNHAFGLLIVMLGACSPTDQSCSGPVSECDEAGAGQACKLAGGEAGQCLPAKDGGEGLRCYPKEEPTPAP